MASNSSPNRLQWFLVFFLIVIAGATVLVYTTKKSREHSKITEQLAIDSIMNRITDETISPDTSGDTIKIPLQKTDTAFNTITDQLKDVIPGEVSPPPVITPKMGTFQIIIASHSTKENAQKALKEFEDKNLSASIIETEIDKQKFYRVCLTGFRDQLTAKKAMDSLVTTGIIKDAWISKTE